MAPIDPHAPPHLDAETPRAERILARCREIATHTEIPGQITRTFLCPPAHRVHDLLRGWMQAAGIETSIDAAGNLRGLYPASRLGAPRIILGSHLDTVPNAGAFDGILGVVMAIAAVEALAQPLPIAIEVIGFSEEEGVRFSQPFLGSLAVVGRLGPAMLALVDEQGISVADAIRHFALDPSQLPQAKLAPDATAYLEIHIEQGPILHKAAESNSPHSPSALGVVEAIVGQSRLRFTFQGQANHAGTTPMHLRRDALAAAAAWMVAVETLACQVPGLVATVGHIDVEPGATNVIPGLVQATLDLRHPDDATRRESVADLLAQANVEGHKRGVSVSHTMVFDQAAVPLHGGLANLLQAAASRAGHVPHRMSSGAGHDAMILAPYLPTAMLFVPSPGGLSHHPDESVDARKIEAALDTTLEFLKMLSDDETLKHLRKEGP